MNALLEKQKSNIIAAVKECDNVYLLTQMESMLRRQQHLENLNALCKQFPILLKKNRPQDKVVKTDLNSPTSNLLSKYDSAAIPVFFYIALIMLMLAAALVNSIAGANSETFTLLFQERIARFYLIGMLLFVADYVVLLYLSNKTRNKLAISEFILRTVALLFPPLRLASRHIQKVELIWMPIYGWSKCNEGLLKLMKRKFSIPMIIIALLIIPVLLVEWKFYDEVAAFLNTDLSFYLDMVQAFIWMAFAFEFIIMFSISNEKINYAKKNWIDILIILLPFIAFIRTLRIIKIARLTQLARGYKLRGLLMKARQGFIFASFFQRILTIKPMYQIKNLKKKLDVNHKEREAIEDELIELYDALDLKYNYKDATSTVV